MISGTNPLNCTFMKKIFYLSLALMTLVAVSCEKENITDNETPVAEGKTLVLEAVAPADVTASPFGTKTTMVPNGENYSVNWSANDAISVNGVASSSIEIAEDNAKSATFTVSGVEAPCCAVYPAAVASDFDAASATVTLPEIQKYTADSFDPAASVMLGYMEEEGELAFSHAMAYLYLTINTVDDYDNDNIKTVTVKSLGTEPMSGAFDVTFGSEGCTMAPAEGTASTEVTVDCGAAGVAKGTPVVVALPAGTYPSGLVITITDVNGDTKTQTAATELELKAGYVYTATLRVAAPGIYNVAGYNAFAKAVNDGDYSAWVNPLDGEVNLYADITTDKDYVYVDAKEFDGKFDGNHHTMTSTNRSLPMFKTIAATGVVKNLNLVNTFKALTQFGEGAFSGFAKVNLGLIDGCSHTVSLEDADFATDNEFDHTSAGLAFGGFVWANGGTIQNSTMNGTVNIAYKPASSLDACYGGGFAALGHNVIPYTGSGTINTDGTCKPGKFINCENKANIKVQTNTNRAGRDAMGGICGLSYLDGVEFTECKNTGKLERYRYLGTATINNSMSLGGILGQGASWYVGSPDAREAKATASGKGFNTKITGCENAGEVILKARVASANNGVNANNNANRNLAVGGIVGAIVGNSTDHMAQVTNCKNTGIASGASWSLDQYVIVLGGIAGIASYTDLSGNIVSGTVKSAEGSILGAGGGVVGVAVNGVNISGGEVTGDLSLLFENSKMKVTPRAGICLGIAMYSVNASSIKNVSIAPKSYVITNKASGQLTNPTLTAENFTSHINSTFGSATSMLVKEGNTWGK